MTVFTPAWWEAFGARAAHTAIAVLLPLAALLFGGKTTPLDALSLVAVQVLAVFASSLYALPEITGKTVPLWRAILVRLARTFGQTLATSLVGVTVLEAIDWRAAGLLLGAASLTTLLRTLRDYLPEQEPAVVTVVVEPPA